MSLTVSTSSFKLLLVSVLIFCTGTAAAEAPPKLPHAMPEDAGMNSIKLSEIDDVVAEGIAAKNMPGCVVLVSRHGKIVWLKAYGKQQIEPETQEMPTDAVFDMASVTKPLATATSVMLLVEQGRLDLDAKAAKYWTEFGNKGKEEITVRQLLTHQSGLIADNSIDDYTGHRGSTMQRIADLKLQATPGTKFIYSDVGFIVLGELVRRVSGEELDAFASKHFYQPLGMAETMFAPTPELAQRAVPTEKREGNWLRGQVHDPRAHKLSGVAGHAGLFSTAEDLAVFGQMLLGNGTYAGTRILDQKTVEQMTLPHAVPGGGLRGLGWDIKTGYSSNRGETFSPRAYGHGGFTGVAFWNDPELQLTVVFLSSRLHPNGKGSVNPLAGRIGSIAADAVIDRPLQRAAE